MDFVRRLPVPICGLALGLATVGNLLLKYSAALKAMCGILSFLILLLFTIRVAADFQGFKKELEDPFVFGSLPAYAMALLLLCVYVKPYIGLLANILWFAVLIFQFFLITVFCIHFIAKPNIKNVYPTWFIALVGFVAASVTAPSMGYVALGRVLFWAGFAVYLVLLPVVLYRVKKYPLLEESRPALAIFCSPTGLCLTGYLSSFAGAENPVVFYILLGICVVNYLVVLFMLPKLLRLPFCPSYASFTFPLAICATGFKYASAYLWAHNGIYLFEVMAIIATGIVFASVLYVFTQYCVYLLRPEMQTAV